MKHFVTASLLILGFVACSSKPSLTVEQYTDAMVELGCAHSFENSAKGKEILEKLHVSQDAITEFRQKTDAKIMTNIANEISSRVIECSTGMPQ